MLMSGSVSEWRMASSEWRVVVAILLSCFVPSIRHSLLVTRQQRQRGRRSAVGGALARLRGDVEQACKRYVRALETPRDFADGRLADAGADDRRLGGHPGR